ncbi:shikimate kinase [uncultured Thomasclavelia sp.]|uniref:shikimate kinase n=1 Tax=uncultured Thomasclavelia sp. TaxID=3025759 RepID=UPI0025E0DF45|nr:shikimate kinase [uncultured Thomasclavelia sp.]
MKNIVLIGIMGCGKTTISKMLGEKLGWPVIDIDEYIVDKFNQTINEMFDVSEAYFRNNETECCKELASLHGHVISTGGGVILKSENIEYLKSNGIIIYIDRPIENIVEDVHVASRPLLKEGPQKLYDLDKQRHQLYLDACDYHLINDGTLEEIVDEIISISSSMVVK